MRYRDTGSRRLLATTGMVLGLIAGSTALAQEQPPAPVNVATVIAGEVKAGQSFVGSITPIREAIVGSAVDGRVVEFPVKEGDFVEANGTLAQLLTETIKSELEEAKAELELRQEEWNELKGTRQEEIDQAEAMMNAAEAAYKFSSQNFDRNQALYDRKAITSQVMEEVFSNKIIALETYNERKLAYDLAFAGPRIEKKKQAEAKHKMQKEVVKKLGDQLKKHTIISRFAGYVVAEHTEEGEWVSRGDPVAEIVALDKVDVMANVLESQISYVEKGMTVSVEIPAIAGRTFTGTVEAIVPRGDARTRTFPVKVRLENEISGGVPLLKAGMIARVLLPTGPLKKTLLVPKDAIVLGGQQPMVYQLQRSKPNSPVGDAVPVPVTLGVSKGPLIQIESTLKPGDLVVVRGNERLRPKQKIQIAELVDSQKLFDEIKK